MMYTSVNPRFTIVFFSSENFQFLEVKFSIYLNRRVFVMRRKSKQIKRDSTQTNEEQSNRFPFHEQGDHNARQHPLNYSRRFLLTHI